MALSAACCVRAGGMTAAGAAARRPRPSYCGTAAAAAPIRAASHLPAAQRASRSQCRPVVAASGHASEADPAPAQPAAGPSFINMFKFSLLAVPPCMVACMAGMQAASPVVSGGALLVGLAAVAAQLAIGRKMTAYYAEHECYRLSRKGLGVSRRAGLCRHVVLERGGGAYLCRPSQSAAVAALHVSACKLKVGCHGSTARWPPWPWRPGMAHRVVRPLPATCSSRA